VDLDVLGSVEAAAALDDDATAASDDHRLGERS
jgi:hypothetical protein